MESERDTLDLILEGAGSTPAARDVAVQAFGAMSAFLENGEEMPLAYAARLYINAALVNEQPAANVTGSLSHLAQYAMQRCCEDRHRKRYETMTSVIARCVANDLASPGSAKDLNNSSVQPAGKDLASGVNPKINYAS